MSKWVGIAGTKPYTTKSSSNSLTHSTFPSQFAFTFAEFFTQFRRQRWIEFVFMGRTRDRQFVASVVAARLKPEL